MSLCSLSPDSEHKSRYDTETQSTGLYRCDRCHKLMTEPRMKSTVVPGIMFRLTSRHRTESVSKEC